MTFATEFTVHFCFFVLFSLQLNGAKPNDEFMVDPKRLRCWLRHMQNELSKFPSISDAIKMKDFELMKLQKKILVSEFKSIFLGFNTLEIQKIEKKFDKSTVVAAHKPRMKEINVIVDHKDTKKRKKEKKRTQIEIVQ